MGLSLIEAANPVRIGLETPVTKLFQNGLTMRKIRYVIVLRHDSETADLFHDNYDARDGESRVLHCEEMELSGHHARVVRLPAPSSKAASYGASRQTFWFPTSDIALAC